MQVSTGANVSSAPSINQSAMISERARGRGSDFGGRGHGFVRGKRGPYGRRQSGSEKGPWQCRQCGRSNHVSEKCWEKFSRPEEAQLSESDSSAPCNTPQDYSSTSSTLPESSTIVLTQEEYDRLRQLEFLSGQSFSNSCICFRHARLYCFLLKNRKY